VGSAGTIYGCPYGERQNIFSAAHHQNGPARKDSLAGLQQQFKLSNDLYTQLLMLSPAAEQAGALRKQLKDLQTRATGEALAAINALDQKLQALPVAQRVGPARDGTADSWRFKNKVPHALRGLSGKLTSLPARRPAAVADLEKTAAFNGSLEFS